MDFLKTNLSRANSYIRGQNDPQEEEASFMNELDKEMSMSYKNRLILFITCLGLGILLCFLATWSILSPRKFAKFYTLGTVLLLASTAFLVGPKQQLKSMFHPSRLTAALIYLFSVVITLYSAIGVKNKNYFLKK